MEIIGVIMENIGVMMVNVGVLAVRVDGHLLIRFQANWSESDCSKHILFILAKVEQECFLVSKFWIEIWIDLVKIQWNPVSVKVIQEEERET